MPAAIFVDVHGLGAGVYDRLNQLGYPVVPAQNVSDNSDRDYTKTGDRWWGDMKEWLAYGSIPDDEILGDLIHPAEKDFWARLLDGEIFDASVGGRPEMSSDWLKSLHPDDNGTTIRK